MPKTLYHYCSLETLLTILKSKTIRLSDLRKMQDSCERSWVWRRMEPLLKDAYSKLDALDTPERSLKALEHITEYWESWLLPGGAYSEYALCLSEKRDLLSQWRGFADDGHGVSIGYNVGVLRLLEGKKCFSLKSIDYSFDELKIKEKVEQLLKYLQTDFLLTREDALEVDGMLDLMAVANYMFVKNPAFIEEAEWRLVFQPNYAKDNEREKSFTYKEFGIKSLQHRATRDKIVGYHDIDVSGYLDSLISSITVGPKCRATYIDIMEMTYALGYSGIEYFASEATYCS